MTVGPGTTLLHYRLAEKIGEGGMGHVWRATDTSLAREVAIKIFPAEVAGDPERIARFEREARVLAALNSRRDRLGPRAARGGRWAVLPDGSGFLVLEAVPGQGPRSISLVPVTRPASPAHAR